MKHRASIGIEISAHEVRGACIRSSAGGIQLTAVGSIPTPPHSVDSEGMLEAQVIGAAVRHLCAQLDPKVNQVVVGITGCNLVARVMEIPPVPDPEVRSVLRGEMDHYRILPAGQSAFDFYRLPDPPNHESEESEEAVSRVLLMGAEERLVASYRAVVDASSLNLVAVEPGAIAVLRALYPMVTSEDAMATVILSASGTDILITHEGALQFYRRVDTGVPELRSQSLAAETAAGQGNKRALGGPLSLADDEEYVEEEAASPGQSDELFNRQAISLLMTEVQRSIDYYLREYPTAGERMIVRFAIDAPDAPDLFGVMTQYLRSSAEMASVVDTLPVAPEAAAILLGDDAFRYTTAIGLGLRGHSGYEHAPMLDLGIGDRVIVERRLAPRVMMASMSASGLILAGTMIAALIVGGNINRADRTFKQTKTELTTLTQETAAKVSVLDRQKNLTTAILKRDKPLRQAIEYVSASVSRNASLTSLAIDQSGAIFLSGEAFAPKTVADIMDTINLSPTLDPIRLSNLQRVETDKLVGIKFDLQTAFAQPVATTAAPKPAGPTGATQGGS